MRPRYEFKYVLAPGQIEQVRAYAQTYLERDALGDDGCYIVTSLYYDTMDWRFAADVREGLRERIKLRVRHYEGPATFAEIKERVGLTILKERALIPAGLVDHVVHRTPFVGELPGSLGRWCGFRDTMVLHPRVWVAYDREAWGSPFGDGARLTFDRHVRVQAYKLGRTRPPADGWMPSGPETLLELKFGAAWPGWMKKMVQRLQLRRISNSKYMVGATTLGDLPWSDLERSVTWTAC